MNTSSAKKMGYIRFARALETGVSLLFQIVNWIVFALMVVMCAVMLTQVFSRYLFNYPLTWPEEISRYLFIWIVFLGSAMALRHKAHLGMDFATAKLGPGLKKLAEHMVSIMLLAFLGLILYIAPEILSITQFQKSPVIHISMNYIYLSFPLASALMILDLVSSWICEAVKKEN